MEHLEQRQKVIIMTAIMSAMLFAALNQTIVGTALPVIVADIGGMSYFSWVFTIYMLTTSLTALLVGKLSDTYGRKPFILIGIGIFTIGSLLCGTSVNIIQLILYRGLQGFGAGMIMSTSFAAIGDLFPPRERGRWQGLLSSVFGLASVFGPTLGGYIVDHFDWHWVFWVFLPFGFVAFGMIMKLFPHIKGEGEKGVDFLGAITIALTIGPLLLAFSWAGNLFEWGSPVIIGLFVWSAFALGLFIFIEKRAKNAIIPLHLFKNSIFTISNVAGFMIGMGMFGAVMYMPFFLQGVMSVSATKTGFVMMFMTLSMVLTSTGGGQLVTKTGKYKIFALAGLLIMACGMLSMAFMTMDSSVIRAVLSLMLVGLGLGLSFPIFTLTVQNAVDHRYLGVSTSSAQFFRQAGGTIGVSIMGAVMNVLMQRQMTNMSGDLPEGGLQAAGGIEKIGDPQVLMDQQKLAELQQSLPAESLPMFNQLLQTMREALSTALSGSFIFGTIILGIAFILTLFLKEIPLRLTNQSESEITQDEQKKQIASSK
ncbi:MDR family MFS transporter [Bacillus tianshenii]|nr:MDR family MFS transporter [Bacillus tianshenii]